MKHRIAILFFSEYVVCDLKIENIKIMWTFNRQATGKSDNNNPVDDTETTEIARQPWIHS